jgi:hypothetical protein
MTKGKTLAGQHILVLNCVHVASTTEVSCLDRRHHIFQVLFCLLQAAQAAFSSPAAVAILGSFGSKSVEAPARSVRAMATASNGSDVPPGQELAVLVRVLPLHMKSSCSSCDA